MPEATKRLMRLKFRPDVFLLEPRLRAGVFLFLVVVIQSLMVSRGWARKSFVGLVVRLFSSDRATNCVSYLKPIFCDERGNVHGLSPLMQIGFGRHVNAASAVVQGKREV